MNVRRLTTILALAATLVCWAICDRSPAQAAFTPFQLASANPALGLQAEYAYEPAVSADGDYVAFTGVVGKPGVYRKDLATGELETVALGTGTGAPSISADGRYVSFTTSDDPLTGDPTSDGCTQVYRRDMNKQPAEEGAYEIASALNDSKEPLTYQGSANTAGKCPGGGSASANRVALSAEGSEVVFTVIGQSDLTAACTTTTVPPEPPRTTCPTPPEQVAVRDFDTDSTTLVSVTLASLGGPPQPVPAGATLSGMPFLEAAQRRGTGGGTIELSRDAASTAAISADGNTVAWMGINVAAQAPARGLSSLKYADEYSEPLWRHIADGPAAPTRRVLAGDDPSAPSCPPNCSGGLELHWEQLDLSEYKGAGPAYGSYIANAESGFGSGLSTVTPQLSADGSRVAILSTEPDYEHLPDFGGVTTLKAKPPPANVFIVNMTPGLTRAQAITRLTEWGSVDFSNSGLDGSVNQIAISSDGTRVAFTTERVVFALAPPVLVTPPVNQAETPQLYEANLKAGTLALVSQGYNGEPANHEGSFGGVSAVALSRDGRVLALASGSSNLAFGAINEGSDVFVTEEIDSPPITGQQSVTPLPPGPSGEPGWSISATARPSSDGSLLIDVYVPGAGRLAASASASVAATVAVGSHPRGRARSPRGKRTSATRGARGARVRSRTVTVIATRQIAHAASATDSEGLLQLRLTPSSRYRSLAYGKDGLYATVTVAFAAPGHRLLTQTLQAGFPRPSRIYRLPEPPRRRRKHGSRSLSRHRRSRA